MSGATIEHRLLSCREADKAYRLRSGTIAKAVKSRQMPGRITRKTIFVTARAVERFLGVS